MLRKKYGRLKSCNQTLSDQEFKFKSSMRARESCTQKCLMYLLSIAHRIVPISQPSVSKPLPSIRMSSTFRKKYGRLKSCNCPQIVISRVQIQMLNDTNRKCCTQKCLIYFFHPSLEELCQLVIHQLVSLCLALECNQHLKKIWQT